MIITKQNRIYLPQQLGADWYYDSMNVDGDGGVLTDFAAVQNFKNLSLNGNDLTQSNASIAPFYRTMTLMNQNTLSVNGSKYMTGDVLTYADEISIVALVECDVNFLSQAGSFVSYGSGGVSLGNGITNFGRFRLSCTGVGDFETTSDVFINGQFCVVAAVLKNISGTWSIDFYKNNVFIQNIAAAQPNASIDNFVLSANDNSGGNGWLGQIVALAGWHQAISRWTLNQAMLNFMIRANLF